MNNKKLAFAGLVLSSMVLFAGTSVFAGEGIQITDMAGREIQLDQPAERVIALTASDCEIIYALGKGDLLVGRGEYCDYPAEAADIPSVSSGADTNVEEIIALQPQVLIMSTMAQSEDQIATLENAGIKIVVSDAQDIDGVYTAIDMIGTLTGSDEEADALCTDMQNTFADLKEKAAGKDGGSIYFEVSPLQWGLWAAGNHTFMNEAAEMLGLTNIFGDVDGWAEISEEQVIEKNPDHIMTISMYSGEGDTPEEEILKRSGWEDITAVKDASILNLPNNELSRPGPRLVEGVQMLYDFVYGE